MDGLEWVGQGWETRAAAWGGACQDACGTQSQCLLRRGTTPCVRACAFAGRPADLRLCTTHSSELNKPLPPERDEARYIVFDGDVDAVRTGAREVLRRLVRCRTAAWLGPGLVRKVAHAAACQLLMSYPCAQSVCTPVQRTCCAFSPTPCIGLG